MSASLNVDLIFTLNTSSEKSSQVTLNLGLYALLSTNTNTISAEKNKISQVEKSL